MDDGQSNDRRLDQRADVGLVSRFLGGVFLVLLGGLLLLDRALLQANRNQATLDAQSAALLTESVVTEQFDVLERIGEIVSRNEVAINRREAHEQVERLLARRPGVRYAWAMDASGQLQLDASKANGQPPLNPQMLLRLQALQPLAEFTLVVLPASPRHALVAILHSATWRHGGTGPIIGLVFDGLVLQSWLQRTPSDTRLSLAVVSGIDTVAYLGQAGGSAQGLSAAQRIARLPTGGTWTISATHALTTRALRWALWMIGVLGVLLLAVGLLREQRRMLQATDRSLELERLYSDVKRANQAKSEFLANISHELRTPLNAIVGFVELLRDGFYGDLSPRQVPPVDRIAASASHLRHLVDQVLDIAKIAAGRLEVHPETIVLRPFVLNIASELESLVSEKGLSFSITVGASLPRVRTDPAHLRQILINLIGNAVKYTPSGTVSVRTRLVGAPTPTSGTRRVSMSSMDTTGERTSPPSLSHSGTWVALQVVDTGVGIGPENFDRIFDEFEQVNAGPRGDSMQRGTGLGLAISRRLARLLGGEISVESEHGRGSIFTVWLPINAADLIREPASMAFPVADTTA